MEIEKSRHRRSITTYLLPRSIPAYLHWDTNGSSGVVEEAGDGGENKWQHGKGSSTVATNDNMFPEGPVAQRSEQGTHNPLVQGSNPCGPSVKCFSRRVCVRVIPVDFFG